MGRVDLGVELIYKVLFGVYIRVRVGVEVRIWCLHGSIFSLEILIYDFWLKLVFRLG